MTRFAADLHVHSNRSDGAYPPARVVELVCAAGVSAMALTDHDTTDGLEEAGRAAAQAGIDFISGIELTCDVDGRDVHLLGYLFDPGFPALRDHVARLRERRAERGREMVERLNALGIAIRFEEVERQAGGAAIGRPHVARALVASRAVPSLDEVFRRYLADGGPAHVPARVISCGDAIALVRAAGGLAVLAHPGLHRKRLDAEALIVALRPAGLSGIEVWHPKHRDEEVRKLARIAEEQGLLATGGSDFHGPSLLDVAPGVSGVSLETIDRMRAALP